MRDPFFIKKVAVLGAGVMGAQIAAHCANAGFATLLYDLAAQDGEPNSLVEKALLGLTKLKPAPLGTPKTLSFIQARNYQEHLEDLSSCDLIIEAIAERMDWKEALYEKIAPYIKDTSVLVTNTSGLSINALAEKLPPQLRPHFCGVHFFNPPRYMHLAELIPAQATSVELLDDLETWLTSYLGKGVVRAKDTPNFIANRIGVFSLLITLHHTVAMEMSLDEVDALTGALLGRPKSATFRTMDVVGLDTMQHVVHTMQEHLKDDPWHQYFSLPDWLTSLISKGHLGQKSGCGIYRKNGKAIEVYDYHTNSYIPSEAQVSSEVRDIMRHKDAGARMQALFDSDNKQARFLSACFRDLFHYCAYHVATIAETVRDIDLAMRWGFGWSQGPFATWQLAGFKLTAEMMNQAIKDKSALSVAPLPLWLNEVEQFYKEEGAYAPCKKSYEAPSTLPVYQRQYLPEPFLMERAERPQIIYENEGVSLSYLQDEVALISFKSKANTVGQEVLDGLEEALERAERNYEGLIIYQKDATNFSSGADLRQVATLINARNFATLEGMIAHFQRVAGRLKYSPIPVVAALRGRALGGGCELMMHCSAVVSAFEAYPGLVEFGVGLIPAGGGCKEMAARAAYHSPQEPFPLLQNYFQQIATAQVAGSALEARNMGYLKSTDTLLMHGGEVLFGALNKVKALKAFNYLPPRKESIQIAGIEGQARIEAGLVNWLAGGFISQHDYFIANELAQVLCGGNLHEKTLVDEEWLLGLEREAFMRLAEHPLTQARIQHLLETGKPLRN